jgi:hypothetical protein
MMYRDRISPTIIKVCVALEANRALRVSLKRVSPKNADVLAGESQRRYDI